MAFLVSARKYRPNRFEDVVGQEHIAKTLKNAIKNDKLAHSFLFCGPRGVGKTTCARILAKVINCQNIGSDFEPCNACPSCTAFHENASFNIIELDAASNNSVEHIRLLIEQVRFQPQQGKFKVFIIDEVHMLSPQAFNAFLKTLEEPPPYAIFILATTEKHKIIPTILSRCQIFDFKRIQVAEIVRHLQHICQLEGIVAEEEALHVIAQKADGALRDALSIFDRIASSTSQNLRYEDVIQNLNVLDYDYFFRLTDAVLREDVAGVLITLDAVVRNGFEPDLFMGSLLEHFRNLLVCKDAETLALLEVGPALKQRYAAQAELCSPSLLVSALNIGNECDIHYKTARNKRLHTEMALIKMALLNRIYQIPQAPTALEQATTKSVEKKASPAKVVVQATKPLSEPAPAHESKDPNPAATVRPKWNKKVLGESPVLKDLEALTAEVAAEVSQQAVSSLPLTLENLLQAWNQYSQSKERHVRAVLENTEVRLEGKKLVPVVSSSLAKNTLLQETGLMEFLRQTFHDNDLVWEVEIDEAKAAQLALSKLPKSLTPREKYQKMLEVNPLIKDLLDQFDLTLEE